MQRPALFSPPTCRRCGRRDHVITVDGPPICRICVLAWGSLAGRLYAAAPPLEPSLDELRHGEHRVRQSGCWYCVASMPRPSSERPLA